MTKAEGVLFTLAIFTLLLVAYGQASSSPVIQQQFNTIFGAWPTFQQVLTQFTSPIKGCAAWDWGCNAAAGVAQATAFVGAVIAYPSVLGGSALARISSFGNFVSLLLGATNSASTIPFFVIFAFGLGTFVIFEAFRMFRGNSTAGV